MESVENMRNEMNHLKDYINEYECNECYDCQNCQDVKECYYLATQRENTAYAESLDYGGYDTEEEFWEQIYNF